MGEKPPKERLVTSHFNAVRPQLLRNRRVISMYDIRKIGKSWIRKPFHALGLDLVRLRPKTGGDHNIKRRIELLKYHRIDVVLDVGANNGQYAAQLRAYGYDGKIISFEPLSHAYAVLCEKSRNDSKWDTMNVALGDIDGSAHINVSLNSYSSSILDMLPSHLEVDPDSRYVGDEEIRITTVDAVIDGYRKDGERVFLKIDTQGYERNVIMGAETALGKIIGVQMEVSLVPLYEGEMLLVEAVELMAARGFSPASLEPGCRNPKTGHLCQVDCIFFRTR